jgi:Zn-dependent protease
VASVGAFSIGGIRVRIDQTWFVAFLLFAWTLSAGYFPQQVPYYSTSTYWFFGTLCSLALFGSVLIHELSHCVVAQRLGIRVRQITLFIFGGVSEMDETQSSGPSAEFRIAIAGPMASLGLSGLFWALALLGRTWSEGIVIEVLRYLYHVNFLLAVFNLIPGFPLDGGRVLRAWLWHRTGNPSKATRSAAWVGGVFATILMGLGLVSVLIMHVIPGLWLILIGWFLKKSADAEYRSFEARVGLQNMKLEEIMTPPITVDTATTIAEFVNEYVFHHHYRVFPVVENGRFAGMIDVRSIKGVPPQDWPVTPIGSFVSNPATYCVLSPDTDAGDALRILMSRNCSEAPVVRNGFLVGMLTRGDLFRLIALKSDLAA